MTDKEFQRMRDMMREEITASEERVVGQLRGEIKQSEETLRGEIKASEERVTMQLRGEIKASEDTLRGEIKASEERVVAQINREVVDLAEINRAVIAKVSLIPELQQRVARIEQHLDLQPLPQSLR